MRKPFIALAAAGTIALGTVSALQAQVFPPLFPQPVAPVVAPIPAEPTRTPVPITSSRTSLDLEMGLGAAADRTDEHLAPVSGAAVPSDVPAIATLRRLLADRGFGADVVGGYMTALPPGQAGPEDFGHDGEIDALLGPGIQAQAWLIQTDAGRWWLWDYGAAAPADQRAEVYQTHALRQAEIEGRLVGD